ncbi:MAG: SUMF1/EgtB/PvdO family nonheme iron enzyme, partial [Bacteroidales bacterium]|nr:SUMF1/EgtB/PvdO family nonheme iron enzyme [Bacteroidales bacterium]
DMKRINFLMLCVLAVVSSLTFFGCNKVEQPKPDDPIVQPEPDPDPDPVPEISAPVVATGEVTDVTENSAATSFTITSDGGAAITACGIVWDEEANPTEDLPTKVTFDGTETSYTAQLTDLDPSTTYYYRAYAINEAGTAYGEEYSFTTGTATTMTVDVNGITIELALVEGGTFTMGATPDLIALYDKYDADEVPAHEVTLGTYYMGKYEVTQALWIEIMGANPSQIIRDNNCPVDGMSYLQCLQFIEKLNERTGLNFNLPTEAQWEYAARGGNKSKGYLYSGSNDATEVGWVMENMSTFGQHPGGEKAPNELGIYDMTGNVNEWCYDFYGAYPEEPQTNPSGAAISSSYSLYVVRGGAYSCESARWCRNTKRQSYPENFAQMDIGFRLVLNTPESEPAPRPEPEPAIFAPSVTTGEVSYVTENSATTSLSITSDGGAAVTACGIVWDVAPNPTEALSTKITFDGTANDYTCQLTGLDAGTTYYYRAFATNEVGTSYGEEHSFTTRKATPSESALNVEINGLTIEMVLVEGGTFQMGATSDLMDLGPYDDDELPAHKVTLDSYYMAKYEVTQALWIEVMGSNPSQMIKDNARPVDGMSHIQCLEFIEKLNERTGMKFSLPTEAQWEYAARGGNKSQGYLYSGSNDATEVGVVYENIDWSDYGQRPGGTKAPNELGIYDMTGNLMEWCYDVYAPYTEEAQINPTGGERSDYNVCVVRGGGYWDECAKWSRNTKRNRYAETHSQLDLGLRLVLNVE